jgi:hypothetical protein
MIGKEISGAEIARWIGCTRQNAHHIIIGKIRTPHIRQVIVDALSVQVSDLWSDEKPQRKTA